MTKEEHIARAMLMGMRYMSEGNYYLKDGGTAATRFRFDGDTLEPLTLDQSRKKHLDWIKAYAQNF